jgi:ATP-dependent Lhr-like helicase
VATRPSPLDCFHRPVAEWFTATFSAPTKPQRLGWPAIARGESALLLAPTGTGKTLAAFLWCLNRVMFDPVPDRDHRLRVLYVSPLKALAVDVERNLRAPLAGIANAAAAQGVAVTMPELAIRTGDTPAEERARFDRQSADILITTPESLFLLLTSNARRRLRTIDTVIVDEIHALVPTKRGAHLALSLERLDALRSTADAGRPAGATGTTRAQRIGLSATQHPLDEVARFLGGAEPARDDVARGRTPARAPAAKSGPRKAKVGASELRSDLHEEFRDAETKARFRPVTIVDASEPKTLRLRVDMPVEDMARLTPAVQIANGPAAQGLVKPSIWTAIQPRLLELVRAHRTTLLFVNSRRLAERLAGALNELAGEPLVRSHHGSLARAARGEVEDLLKAGRIRGLVATSSLELGIDMGAIDLVVQIEAPPSVASGLQRVGRAGHQAGATSDGIIFPKFRGDLVACAAVSRAMHEGRVESTRYPRNPLDVLAQQVVAMVGMDEWGSDALFAAVRRAAPFSDLSRRMFDGVLDMLSGRYPSDEFAELRPRVTWDRVRNLVTGRQGAVRVAIANAGTIPDRGLYGVFLAGADRPVRVGELDEEMVFESEVGDTFTLGASTWRIESITHDRVLVSPAPGEPGKMPFWRGDQVGRPVELGRMIGRLVRELTAAPRDAALDRLMGPHDLERTAAENLLQYLNEQAATAAVPDDRTLVIERCQDELGDWRLCLLSPLGGRIHAPWAMAVTARVRAELDLDVEVMWGDDGFVVRFPAGDRLPDPLWLIPDPDEVEGLLLRQLGATSLFAARFREAAGRALLLPRRRPGMRTPLWQQRKRAADLLAVAAKFGSFPMLLETYREILRDHFDMPGLVETLARVRSRAIRVRAIDSTTPSPFAASLLFNYVANYLYDGDAPLAERRAQALSVDPGQLRELLGQAELRELLDIGAIEAAERQLQHLDEGFKVRTADGLHDLLLRIGDLTEEELAARSTLADLSGTLAELAAAKRVVCLPLGGERRYLAVEDVARVRDSLGVPPPRGIPETLLEPVRDPSGDLVMKFARSRGPFAARALADRYGLGVSIAEGLLARLAGEGRLIEGEFRPGGTDREWVDAEVLRSIRRRSLARLRREVEPVEADALARFLVDWQGIGRGPAGLDSLLDAVERLQGAPIPASVLESDILPARVANYEPAMLDALMTAGEVTWTGLEPLGDRDGRVALYLTDHVHALRPPDADTSPLAEGRAADALGYLHQHGASFFGAIHEGTGGGFPGETLDALWDLVWRGLVTNDTLHALRAYLRPAERRGPRRGTFRSRRLVPRGGEGRWSAMRGADTPGPSPTAWSAAVAQQLLTRHGIVTRETAAAESVPGGFSSVYAVLKAMEEAGRARRGYFVAGLGGAQFASAGALDRLRAHRDAEEPPRVVVVAATDPANPYGAIVKWPGRATAGEEVAPGGPTRTVGALVVLVGGVAAGYLRRGERELLLFPDVRDPEGSMTARHVARALHRLALGRDEARRGMLITEMNGVPATTHTLSAVFVEEGFASTALGLQVRRPRDENT